MQDARSREIELRIAEREGKLIETDEALAALDEIVGGMKADLLGFPARMTRDGEMRRKLEDGVDDLLRRAAERCRARGAELRPGGGAT